MGVALSTAHWGSNDALAEGFVAFDTSFLNLA